MKRKKKGDRDDLGDRLEALIRRKEEVSTWKEMRKKRGGCTTQKRFEAEQRLCSALREHVDTFDRDRGQS